MSTLVSLRDYRSKQRQAYMARHGTRINRIIERFVTLHVDVSLGEMQSLYMEGNRAAIPETWDYVHFREILAEVFDEVIGKTLYAALEGHYWFDRRMISREEVVERALRSYIMEQTEYAITGD